jgi:hypothetical protein
VGAVGKEKYIMKTLPECFPCFMRQAMLAAKLAGDDPQLQMKALKEAAAVLMNAPVDRDPPYIATGMFHAVYRVMNNADPYAAVKQKYNEIVIKKYTALGDIIAQSTDALKTAVRLSIAGNIIDFGILEQFDLDNIIEESLSMPLAIDHYKQFTETLRAAKQLLFIADNAGEIGFDRLLIDEIHRLYPDVAVTVAVKKIPIINDAMVFDAQFFGLEIRNRIIDNGSTHVGTFLPSCSPEMIAAYQRADMIIAKGQANWESMNNSGDNRVFYMMKAKCAYVAEAIGAKLHDIILKQG